MQPLLIIDDDDDLRATLAEILGAQGHAVQHFADAREALSALRGGLQPSLILLDLMMPEMNGWEFRAEQKKDPALNAIPVLVITARTAGDLRRETLGDVEILKKPFTIVELNHAMERASSSMSYSSHGE
jgi:CheY-like chemotaxis protein